MYAPTKTRGYLPRTCKGAQPGGGAVIGACRKNGGVARARLRAEAEWRVFGNMTRTPVDILRLPGIYGPGRSVLDQLRARRARRILKPGHVFNRIHVDDIAACVLAAMRRPDANGRTLNLSDDEPESADVLLAHAARLLEIDLPPAIAWDDPALPEMARGFYSENRRIRNGRMKEALGVTLRYPTWREGLAAVAAERNLTDANLTSRWSWVTRHPNHHQGDVMAYAVHNGNANAGSTGIRFTDQGRSNAN